MIGASTTPAQCTTIELEIAIEAPRERVWSAIFDETDLWWLPDFRVMGADSKVTFDPQPGGRGMVEDLADGGGLLWFNVQMYIPSEFKVYLTGHIAPEWGGPTTSMLKLALDEAESGCVFKLTDARHGHVDEKMTENYRAGWQQLFGDGLKKFVESKA